MSRGINKVIIVGNLGSDPETRYTQSNSAVTTLSIATSESWKDRNTGDMQERTEWHRVVMFSRLAEIAGEYLQKGRQVYIEGKLRTRKWQDNNGNDRYTTEIVADEMQMLGGRAGGGSSAPFQGGQDSADNFGGGRAQTQPAGNTGSGNPPPPQDEPFDDDDIPF